MNTTHIYTLAHPITGVIRYVGKANDLAHRLAVHVRKDEGTKKSNWILSLKRKGLKPVMEVLDIVPAGEWQFWEMYWISQLKAWGFTLYNGDNGGLGSDRLPSLIKAKIGDTLRGREAPHRWRPYHQYDLQGNLLATYPSSLAAAKAVGGNHANLSRSVRTGQQAYGYVWRTGAAPEANITTLFDASGKIPATEERRRKQSERQRGTKMPPIKEETRAKMRLARLGKEPANKGIPQTAAQKAALREASTTRKAVHQLSMDGAFIKEWGSIKEAAFETGATRAGILNSIKGKNKHAGGFKWVRPITNPS